MEQTERNGLEAFRQLRKEARHSEEYLAVGIDIAKERYHAFFGTARGKINPQVDSSGEASVKLV